MTSAVIRVAVGKKGHDAHRVQHRHRLAARVANGAKGLSSSLPYPFSQTCLFDGLARVKYVVDYAPISSR